MRKTIAVLVLAAPLSFAASAFAQATQDETEGERRRESETWSRTTESETWAQKDEARHRHHAKKHNGSYVEDYKGWRTELQAFGWFPARVDGDVTVRDRQLPIDVTIDDAADPPQFATQLRFEAWHGRLGLILDTNYLQTGQEGTVDTELMGPDGGTTTATVPVDLTTRFFTQDALLGVRLLTLSPNGVPSLGVEVHGGGRVAWIRNEADVGPQDLNEDRVTGKGVVGVRVPMRFSKVWSLVGRTTVAIPGPTVTALGFIQIDMARAAAFKIGYRVDRVDLTESEPQADFTAHGPYAGLTLRLGTPPAY